VDKFGEFDEKFSQSEIKAGSEDLGDKGMEVVRGEISLFTRRDETYST